MNYDVYAYLKSASTEYLIGSQTNISAGAWSVSGVPGGSPGAGKEYNIVAKLNEASGVELMVLSSSQYLLYNMPTSSSILVDGTTHTTGGNIFKGSNISAKVDFNSSVINAVLTGHPVPTLRIHCQATVCVTDASPTLATNAYTSTNTTEIQTILATAGVSNPTDGTTYGISSSWFDTHNTSTSARMTSFTFVYQIAQITINSNIINVYSGTSVQISGTITE